MDDASHQDRLKAALERLATPLETPNDLAAVSIQLDALVGLLLREPSVTSRLGPDRVGELAAASPELPAFLNELGGEDFSSAASSAASLSAVARASLADFGDLSEANIARDELHASLSRAMDADDASAPG